jgi:hypothetical protein
MHFFLPLLFSSTRENCPQLVRLNLSACCENETISDAGLRTIANLFALVELNLGRCGDGMTEVAFQQIAHSCTKLSRLEFEFCRPYATYLLMKNVLDFFPLGVNFPIQFKRGGIFSFRHLQFIYLAQQLRY